MSGSGRRTFLRTYFCHRIPPLRIELPTLRRLRRSGGIDKTRMIEDAYRLVRNAKWLVAGVRKVTALSKAADPVTRSQNRSRPFYLPDIRVLRPEKLGGTLRR